MYLRNQLPQISCLLVIIRYRIKFFSTEVVECNKGKVRENNLFAPPFSVAKIPDFHTVEKLRIHLLADEFISSQISEKQHGAFLKTECACPKGLKFCKALICSPHFTARPFARSSPVTPLPFFTFSERPRKTDTHTGKQKNDPSIFAKNKRTFSEKSRDLGHFSSCFQSRNKPKSTHNKSKQKNSTRTYARISKFTFLPSPLHLSFYTSLIQYIRYEHKRSIFLHLCTSLADDSKEKILIYSPYFIDSQNAQTHSVNIPPLYLHLQSTIFQHLTPQR